MYRFAVSTKSKITSQSLFHMFIPCVFPSYIDIAIFFFFTNVIFIDILSFARNIINYDLYYVYKIIFIVIIFYRINFKLTLKFSK